MPTLFVICNGANSTYDVEHAINSTFGGSHSIIKNVGPLKTDKFGNTYTIIDVYSGGQLTQTRMDHLIAQLRSDSRNRGERFKVKQLIEWTIKLHLPKEYTETFIDTSPIFR
jgi:hypothetical protein